MMKHKIVGLFVAGASLIGLALAQSSKVPSSSAKSGPDALRSATKPLTPKSAMPAKRKSSVVVGRGATSGRNATAELTRLERQNVKAGGSKSGSTPKAAPVEKSGSTPDANGSKINFKYEKPVGGLKASTPGANAPSSGTPRVKKN